MASFVKTMRTSVGSVAGVPLAGSTWMKSAAGAACAPDGFVETAVDLDLLAVLETRGPDRPSSGRAVFRGSGRQR